MPGSNIEKKRQYGICLFRKEFEEMKKIAALCLAVMMAFACVGCAGKQEESKYASSLDVLNAVVESYGSDELFAMYGGDMDHAVMDAPGEFDITKTEELENSFGLPESQVSGIDGAASMVHMMNANTFTGAAYQLKDGTDLDAFAEAVKEAVLAKEWMCGIPDTLVIINVDGTYVITAFGEAGIMETFEEKALSALDGAEVLTKEPIA